MNENLKKVMFGKQRQATRQLEAVVEFVQSYLEDATGESYKDTPEEGFVDVIMAELESLVKQPPEDSDFSESDVLFVSLFLESDCAQRVLNREFDDGFKVSGNAVGESGKWEFRVVDDTVVQWPTKVEEATEQEAWDVVKKIVDSCPPRFRATLPQDDALAAVLLSQAYWNANR